MLIIIFNSGDKKVFGGIKELDQWLDEEGYRLINEGVCDDDGFELGKLVYED